MCQPDMVPKDAVSIYTIMTTSEFAFPNPRKLLFIAAMPSALVFISWKKMSFLKKFWNRKE